MTSNKPTNETLAQLLHEILDRLDKIETAQGLLAAELAKIAASSGR